MNISVEELKLLMKKNPNLKIRDQSNSSIKLINRSIDESVNSQKKQPKYRNKKIYEYNSGLISEEKNDKFGKIVAVYDSKKEYDRWKELQLFEKTGEISNLKRQEVFLIQDSFYRNGKKISSIEYKADHVYIKNGKEIIEDVKPFDKKTGKYRFTKDFLIKWKILKHIYPDKKFEIY